MGKLISTYNEVMWILWEIKWYDSISNSDKR